MSSVTTPCAASALASSVATLVISTAEPATVSASVITRSAGALTVWAAAICGTFFLASAIAVVHCSSGLIVASADNVPVAGLNPASSVAISGEAVEAVICSAVSAVGIFAKLGAATSAPVIVEAAPALLVVAIFWFSLATTFSGVTVAAAAAWGTPPTGV